MEPPQTLYGQAATHFRLRFFLRSNTEVQGGLVVELANMFLADLVFPRSDLFSLDTKRPGIGRPLNMGQFSERRWNAAVKKVLAGQYAVIGIQARMPDFPKQQIWLTLHVNPPGGDELLISGTIEVTCSVSCFRHFAADPQKVEALLRFGNRAWNGVDGGPAYGYGNLAISPPRVDVMQWMKAPVGTPLPIQAPAERVHAIPIACAGEVDSHLERLYVKDRGIKGAFWANYLSAVHVGMAGGEQQIRAQLPGLRIEGLNHGGLLVVATDNPLPDDTEDNRRRFLQVHAALQPAFLSREETSDNWRRMLGCFYRERVSVIP